MPNTIVNIATYKFVPLDDLETRRETLLSLCNDLELRGTILLSEEGINLFVAGLRESTNQLLEHLQSDPAIGELPVKESISDHQPYSRMLVKIKAEIITFGVEGIEPAKYTSPRVAPRELKQWLDEGRPVKLLDTRNEYELEVGTFAGAINMGLDDFRHFPEAVERLDENLKDEVVVTFCTGGIRCEKAAPFLEREGFKNVFQLDGGILKYFEDCGDSHYEGECFVFDKRVAVDGSLQETDTTFCFICQANLFPADRDSDKFVFGKSCPHCWTKEAEERAKLVAQRNIAIKKVVDPLPGSVPYENRRPMHVPERLDRSTVIDFLVGIKTHLTRENWLEELAASRLSIHNQPIAADDVVRTGHTVFHTIPLTIEPDVNADVRILFEDDAIVVVDKPAPLPMHPSGRFNRNTLTHIIDQIYFRQRIRPAHRLDANTSGVVVMSKSRTIAAKLQPQFESGTVKKNYLARVHGTTMPDEFQVDAPISAKPEAVGARTIDANGLAATTKFRVLERFADGTSLLEVVPITGRTNQIRVHLWHEQFPVVGDPLYLPDGKIGTKQTIAPTSPPMCLQARRIELTHPKTDERITFECNQAAWAQTDCLSEV